MFEFGQISQISGIILLLLGLLCLVQCSNDQDEGNGQNSYKIEGKVIVPFTADQDWITTSRILLDGGEFLGFLR